MGVPSKGRMAEDTLQLLKARRRRRSGRILALGAWQQGRSAADACAGGLPPPVSLPPPPLPQDCQLSVVKPNPRQYVAGISQVGCCASLVVRGEGGLLPPWSGHTRAP